MERRLLGRRPFAELLTREELRAVREGDLIGVNEFGGILDLSSPLEEGDHVTLKIPESKDLSIFGVPVNERGDLAGLSSLDVDSRFSLLQEWQERRGFAFLARRKTSWAMKIAPEGVRLLRTNLKCLMEGRDIYDGWIGISNSLLWVWAVSINETQESPGEEIPLEILRSDYTIRIRADEWMAKGLYGRLPEAVLAWQERGDLDTVFRLFEESSESPARPFRFL